MDDECAICLLNLKSNINVILCCNHKFHYECFNELQQKFNECPLCRKSFFIKYYKKFNHIKNIIIIFFYITFIVMSIIPLLWLFKIIFNDYILAYIILYSFVIYLYKKYYEFEEIF